MLPRIGNPHWIAVAAILVFFVNLGGAALFDEDEPKNAACGAEMLARGDLLVPSFNHELRTDKPILLYWFMMSAYWVFGVSEFAARFWSASFAVGTVLMVYHLGRILFCRNAGWWAALAMATSLMYLVVGRAATPDATLIFFCTLGMLLYAWSVSQGRSDAWQSGNRNDDTPAERAARFLPQKWSHFAMIYAALALAVLAKGPVGVVLPLAIFGLFLLLIARPETPPANSSDRWAARLRHAWVSLAAIFAPRRVLTVAWQLRPLTALVVLAVIALPWYVAVGIATEGEWLRGFLGKHNVTRFLEPLERHHGPIFYYAIAILVGFFPWSIFLSPTILDAARRMRARHAWHPGYLFAVCWVGVFVVFFSLAQTKLPNYVLPAYPALAVLTGAFVDHWTRQPAQVGGRLVSLSIVCFALVGVGFLVGLPIAAYLVLPGEYGLALLGLAPLAGAAVVWHFHRRLQATRAAGAFAVTSIVFAVALFGIAVPQISRHQNSSRFVQLVDEQAGPAAQVATFDYFVPSLVFYAQDHVPHYFQPHDVERYFADGGQRFLIARAEHLDKIDAALPQDVTILDRQRHFLRKGDLVLLGRSVHHTAGRDPSPARQ